MGESTGTSSQGRSPFRSASRSTSSGPVTPSPSTRPHRIVSTTQGTSQCRPCGSWSAASTTHVSPTRAPFSPHPVPAGTRGRASPSHTATPGQNGVVRHRALFTAFILILTACSSPAAETTLPEPTSTTSSTSSSTTSTSTTTTSTTSTTTTTTTVPTTTTSAAPATTAAPPPTTTTPPATQPTMPAHCRPQMFTDEVVAQIAADYPGKLITAWVHDLRTGCDYSLNPQNRQRTASVFKVMVMAGTLLEAQNEGRLVSDWEMSQLTPMITRSTNDEVRALWNHFGGSPWFKTQRDIFGMGQTRVTADDGSSWGLTTTSARDQVNLLRQVLLGQWGPLQAEYRAVALDLMTSVVSSQTWGVTAGVPSGWRVALKNGFAGPTINSVGWVDGPGSDPGYVVAILSQGWPDHPAGIAAVERVSRIVADAMTR